MLFIAKNLEKKIKEDQRIEIKLQNICQHSKNDRTGNISDGKNTTKSGEIRMNFTIETVEQKNRRNKIYHPCVTQMSRQIHTGNVMMWMMVIVLMMAMTITMTKTTTKAVAEDEDYKGYFWAKIITNGISQANYPYDLSKQ